MTDNLLTQSATPATVPAGINIATEDVGGIHHQKIKIEFGPDGGATLVNTATPLPIGLYDSAGLPITLGWTDTTHCLPVVIAADQPGITVNTEMPPAVAPGDNRSDVTLGTLLPAVQALTLGYNGATYDRLRVANQGVQVAASTPGILVIQGTGTLGAVPISGSITTTAGPGDDTGFTFGTGSPTPVTPAGYVFDEVSIHTLATEDRVAAGRVNASRAQVMVIEDPSGPGTLTKAKVAGGSLQVSIGALGSLVDNLAGTTQVGLGAGAYLYGLDPADSNYDRVKVGVGGIAIPASTPGVLYVQGIGVAGAVPVSGSLSIGGITEGIAALTDPTGPQIMARRVDSTGTPPNLVLSNQVAAGQNVALNATGFGELRVSDLQNYNQLTILANAIWSDGHAWAIGPDNGQATLMLMDEVTPPALAEGAIGVPRLSPNRSQYMQIRDGAGAERGAGVTSRFALQVEGVASGTVIPVSLAANQAVNVAQMGGTNTLKGGTAAGSLAVGGSVATNTAIDTYPLNLGAQTAPTTQVDNSAATAGFLTQLVADAVGKLIVLPYCAPAMMVSGMAGAVTPMSGTTSTQVLTAPAGGYRNYITQITVSNSHATVGTDILIQDGATTLYVIPAAAVYGGATITFPVPLRQPTTGVAINAQNVTTGAATRVSATGYQGR